MRSHSLRIGRHAVARALVCAASAIPLLDGRVAAAQAPSSSAPNAPALVVLIAVDQLRADYLDRYASQFTGGLARFRDQGAFFPEGRQDHAITETAPGHATMLSGREPVHTEIVTNGRGVPDETAPLVGASGPGASPRRFRGTTLVDWLIARDTSIRVLSVSRKDRGAILPIGRAREAVFWYSNGRFTTSRYYADTLPTWVSEFDHGIDVARFAGTTWNLLLPASSYAEPDSVDVEHAGADYTFPHVLPGRADIATRIADYPVMDSLTLAFALRGADAMRLGDRRAREGSPMPDVLSVSLSTTDAVGHAYGPDSREIHDQVLRVDRWLGAVLDSLASRVPLERTLLVLTADHGVSSFPELEVPRTGHGGRLWTADLATAAGLALAGRYHTDFGVEFDGGLVLADTEALHARGVNVDSLAVALADSMSRRAGVARAYTPRTLAAAPESDTAAVRWRRTLPSSLGWLVCAAPQPGYIWSSGRLIAEHGTPNANDVRVPVAFLGDGIQRGRHPAVVRTVDIAPTLAALLGVSPTEPLDGRAIPALAGDAARAALRSNR